jgi:hypothetical protein
VVQVQAIGVGITEIVKVPIPMDDIRNNKHQLEQDLPSCSYQLLGL